MQNLRHHRSTGSFATLRMTVCIILALFLLASSINLAQAEEFRDIGFIEIEEVSEEPGLVSTLGKQFRLIVHHDPLYIPAENLETFAKATSPLLTNLVIIRRDLNRETKNPKNITGDFIFDLEAVSTDSSEHEGFLETKYLSNTQVIKKATRLNFRIETFDYLDNEQTIDTRNIKTKFNAKYDIRSLELDFDSMSFNGESLSFSALDNGKKLSKIISENYIVISNIETSLNLSDSIKDLNFKTESATEKKIASKIKKDGTKGKQSLRLIPKVNNDEITVISTDVDQYQIQIPVYFESKKKLKQTEMLKIENLDLLIMPVFLDLKTTDSRDVNLSGILRDKVNILFNGNPIQN